MIIDQLPLLAGNALTTDEIPIERGVTTYKATLLQALGSVFDTIEPNFADAYDKTATYSVGDYVIYENSLYKCNTAILTAEEWDATHWTQVNVAEELLAILSAVSTKQDKITASSILKGDGSGGVRAAVAGTDYLTPATNYSPCKPISANYSIVESDIGVVLRVDNSNATKTITMPQAISEAMPLWAEIAILSGTTSPSTSIVIVDMSATGGCYGCIDGEPQTFTKFKVKNPFEMVVIKKLYGSSNQWLVSGNVEVVT